MIAFKVALNGKKVAIAGIPGRAVLTAIVTWVRRRSGSPDSSDLEEKLEFHLGGLDSNGEAWDDSTSLSWFDGPLKVGDRLALEIVDRPKVDPPRRSERRKRAASPVNKLRSARHYLALYREQRAQLSQRIRENERIVASLEHKKLAKKR